MPTRKANRTSMRSKKRAKKAHKARTRIVFIVTVLVVLFLIFKGHLNKLDGKDKIAKGIHVCGVDLSGKTKKQAEKKLDKELAKCETVIASFKVEKVETNISLKKLGISYKNSIKNLVNEAYDYGKTGTAIGRYLRLKKAIKNGINLGDGYTVDNKKTNNILGKKLPKFKNGTVNAKIDTSKETPKVIEGKEGIVVDKKATIKKINNLLGSDWNKKQISVEVVSKKGKPEITKAMIKKATDVLGTYTTYYNAGSSSATNIETAAKHIDGTVVLPEEEVSADSLMAPYTKEEGYADAPSYAGNKIVSSMGGGICQDSTTLYNALLLAEIEITQRHAHSMMIAYVEPGFDAAIADDVMDLKFKNNTGYPIYIDVKCGNGELTYTIYGKEYRNSNRDIKYVSESENNETGEKEKSKKKTVTYNLYKITYENGVEISKTFFNSSTYRLDQEGSEGSNGENTAFNSEQMAESNTSNPEQTTENNDSN